jgi:citrate lyase subunit beta/citryl-CoA lyase
MGSADDIRHLEQRLRGLGRPLMLEPQIESAQGIEHAGEIAAASGWVCALHFGPFDLAASLGVPSAASEIPEDLYVHSLIRMLTAARASLCQAVDGPFTDVHDMVGLAASSRRAARLGLDGKWAIHPDQVVAINAMFTPDDGQIARARAIISAYEDAVAKGRGASTMGDEMLDEATRRWAQATLARGNRHPVE